MVETVAKTPVVSIDYFEAAPGDATRYIVTKHTKALVTAILKDLDEFSLKINLKEKSLHQLYAAIVCVEGAIKPHVEKLLKSVVYKLILDEEPGISERSKKIAELLGLYVPTDFILPLIVGHLTD
jgi:hypothetical protein